MVKNLSDIDKAYIARACKSIKFPVNMKEGVFLVPEPMLEEAKDTLEVMHIMKLYDFKIQLVIPGSVKLNEPFDPVLRLAGKRPVTAPVIGLKIGDKFQILSTETDIKIIECTAKKIVLQYVENPLRANIVTTKEQIEKALHLETWRKI